MVDMYKSKKIILVTDGDRAARKAIEVATKNIGGRCISLSAGNPTLLSGSEIVQLVKGAHHNPVVVMVDDRGLQGKGRGEKALEYIINSNDVDVLGVVAVSSNGKDCSGLEVSCSITKEGEVIAGGVDKFGNPIDKKQICGDTLSVLKGLTDLVIVGMGDPGKMDYMDRVEEGAPVTTKALEEVVRRSEKQI